MREFSNLSNTLLDLSKYDMQVKIEYELININELIKSIIEKSKKLFFDKNINLQTSLTEGGVTIKGNRIELCRVFYNVLDNAIKYTSQGGTITISDKINLNKYILNINDTGSGISKEIIDKIFDPFFRGDSARSTEGAGLGLTLAKKIIENHKGTIAIKSQENKGTSVIISLPLSS